MIPKYEALRAAAEKAKIQSFGCVTVLTDVVLSLLADLREREESFDVIVAQRDIAESERAEYLADLRRAEERIKELERRPPAIVLGDQRVSLVSLTAAAQAPCYCANYVRGSRTGGIYCPFHGQVM